LKVHILVFSSKSPFFENYEAFRFAPSRFPDGEGEKSGAQFWVNPPRQTASATPQEGNFWNSISHKSRRDWTFI